MITDKAGIIEHVASIPMSGVMSELAGMTKGKASRWRSIRYETNGSTVTIRDIAYLPDGSIETNGNDRELVARAILQAVSRRRLKRSKAAKQASVTKAVRRERAIYAIAEQFKAGVKFAPASKCMVCGKVITDGPSLLRGIGPDCWQAVLQRIEYLMTDHPTIEDDDDDE